MKTKNLLLLIETFVSIYCLVGIKEENTSGEAGGRLTLVRRSAIGFDNSAEIHVPGC